MAASATAREEVRRLDPASHSDATRSFEALLRSRIVGQDVAIDAMVEVYQTFLVGMNPPDRPLANLLFLGPTGSGKTYVVEVVAEALFGNARAFTKIDCAEFQQSHEIAKLIGSPPGYVGHHDTQPLLTEESLARWHTDTLRLSLVLFDEIEKASEALWQLLLGILDKGELTLGDNRQVNMARCVIFLTSNLGASEMSSLIEGGIGFARERAGVHDAHLDTKIQHSALEAARRRFSPEFMNRLDKVIVFNRLKPEHLERVLDLELEKVQRRITNAAEQQHFTFRCSGEVKEWLLTQGADPRYGARHLKRVIERNIVYSLANLVATGQAVTGDCIEIDIDEHGVLVFSKRVVVPLMASVAT